MIGTCGSGCARAASGHAAAEPPSRAMTSRRFNRSSCIFALPAGARQQDTRFHRISQGNGEAVADQANALWDTVGTLALRSIEIITLFPLTNSHGGAPRGEAPGSRRVLSASQAPACRSWHA